MAGYPPTARCHPARVRTSAGAVGGQSQLRSAIAVALTVAMLVTGTLIALNFALLTGTLAPVATLDEALPAQRDRHDLIRSFYDAANTILAGEDSLLMTTVVTPALEVHLTATKPERGMPGLEQHLSTLRQHGKMSLYPLRLVGGGDEYAAVVEARGPAPAGAERGALLWRATDLFRLDGGMIVEYWPGTADLSASAPPPGATVYAPLRDGGVSLTRLELAADSAPIPLSSPYPYLLLVESGTMAVTRDGPLSLARAGDVQFSLLAPDPGADDVLLRPGDTLLVGEDTTTDIYGAGGASASALSLLIAPRSQLFNQARTLPGDVVTIAGIHDPWRVGRRVNWDSGAVSETLAVSLFPHVEVDPAAIVVDSSTLTLSPGQHLPPLPPGQLQLAIVRAGTISVSGLDEFPAGTPAPGMIPNADAPGSRVFRAGDAFSIEAGEAPVFENTGVTRADILLMQVDPREAADGERHPSMTPDAALQPIADTK